MASSNNRGGIVHIALVGDSDIDRWPPSLIPHHGVTEFTHAQCGESGATLRQVIPLVDQTLGGNGGSEHTTTNTPSNEKGNNSEPADHDDEVVATFLVVCAGENDISTGLSLEESAQAFQDLIDTVFSSSSQHSGQQRRSWNLRMIFLGPKFEPWLEHDKQARRDYIRMSERFRQIVKQQPSDYVRERIRCMDCLTMFCGESGKLPGAIWGGKAIPQSEFFHHDQLHLNDRGYRIWKQVVEECINKSK